MHSLYLFFWRLRLRLTPLHHRSGHKQPTARSALVDSFSAETTAAWVNHRDVTERSSAPTSPMSSAVSWLILHIRNICLVSRLKTRSNGMQLHKLGIGHRLVSSCFFRHHFILSLSSCPFFPQKLMENPYFCQYTVLQVLFFPPSSNEAGKKKGSSLRCHNSRWRTALSSLQICPSFGFGNKWQRLYSTKRERERESKGFYLLFLCVCVCFLLYCVDYHLSTARRTCRANCYSICYCIDHNKQKALGYAPPVNASLSSSD